MIVYLKDSFLVQSIRQLSEFERRFENNPLSETTKVRGDQRLTLLNIYKSQDAHFQKDLLASNYADESGNYASYWEVTKEEGILYLKAV